MKIAEFIYCDGAVRRLERWKIRLVPCGRELHLLSIDHPEERGWAERDGFYLCPKCRAHPRNRALEQWRPS